MMIISAYIWNMSSKQKSIVFNTYFNWNIFETVIATKSFSKEMPKKFSWLHIITNYATLWKLRNLILKKHEIQVHVVFIVLRVTNQDVFAFR